MGLFDMIRGAKETPPPGAHFDDSDGHIRIAKEIVTGRISSISSITTIAGLLITATTIFLSRDQRFVVQIATFCSLAMSLCTAATGSVLIFRLHSPFANWMLYADRPLDIERLADDDPRRTPEDGVIYRAGYSRFHVLNRLQPYTSVLHYTLSASVFFFFLGQCLLVWKDSELLHFNPTKDWSPTTKLVLEVLATVALVGISAIPVIVYLLTGLLFWQAEQKLGAELDVSKDVWRWLWQPRVHYPKPEAETEAPSTVNTTQVGAAPVVGPSKSSPIAIKEPSERTPLLEEPPVNSYEEAPPASSPPKPASKPSSPKD